MQKIIKETYFLKKKLTVQLTKTIKNIPFSKYRYQAVRIGKVGL